ncbi:MAG: methylamine utilization protein [Telluria sp.]
MSRYLSVLLPALLSFGAHAATLSVTVRDAAGKPVPDAVVYAEPETPVAAHNPAPAVIEQKGLKFIPLVTVIQTGTRVNFPNNDKVRHHIYSFSPAHKFEQKLYSGTSATPQLFDKTGIVVLGCNIHDRMIAYVKVVDTPYFAKTDANGAARIELPAAGKFKLAAWHYLIAANANAEQPLVMKGADAAASFALALKPAPVEDAEGY